jgi:hypothetical protein
MDPELLSVVRTRGRSGRGDDMKTAFSFLLVAGMTGAGLAGCDQPAGTGAGDARTSAGGDGGASVDPGVDGGASVDPGDDGGASIDPGVDGGASIDPGVDAGSAMPTDGALEGYWVWEDRVAGSMSLGFAHLDGRARMRMAFGTGNTCHYIWNETTGSDFHTPCTYAISGDMVTYTATADAEGSAAGYSCTHPDWTSWNDRPAVQYGRYRFVGDRLWLGVNAYWGFGGGVTLEGGSSIPVNGSCKRFGYWESLAQAESEDVWIVYRRVTREEWESVGAGSCAACATYPAATVCR